MSKNKTLITTLGVVLGLLTLVMPLFVVAQGDLSATNPVFRFDDGSEVEDSWATLIRAENGLTMALHTSDLNSDEVYTVWWVVFNEPTNCSDACGENDIFMFEEGEPVVDENNNFVLNMEAIEDIQISVQFASGGYVDDDGIGHFGGSTGLGDVPGILFGPGILNPMTAEVHLVVRTHGPVVDEEFDAQITSFGGACGPTDNGLPCADQQFAVFTPPME